jgi:hypothetical protein
MPLIARNSLSHRERARVREPNKEYHSVSLILAFSRREKEPIVPFA